MAKTVAELDSMLDALETAMPAMLKTGRDFWCEFAGLADPIQDAAGAGQLDRVEARIEAILLKFGKTTEDLQPTDCWTTEQRQIE